MGAGVNGPGPTDGKLPPIRPADADAAASGGRRASIGEIATGERGKPPNANTKIYLQPLEKRGAEIITTPANIKTLNLAQIHDEQTLGTLIDQIDALEKSLPTLTEPTPESKSAAPSTAKASIFTKKAKPVSDPNAADRKALTALKLQAGVKSFALGLYSKTWTGISGPIGDLTLRASAGKQQARKQELQGEIRNLALQLNNCIKKDTTAEVLGYTSARFAQNLGPDKLPLIAIYNKDGSTAYISFKATSNDKDLYIPHITFDRPKSASNDSSSATLGSQTKLPPI